MGQAAAVGIDVGGTKLLALVVDEEGTILERRRLESPRADVDGLVAAIVSASEEMAPGLPVGIGVAGIVSADGTLRYGPNLDLADVPLRALVRSELGLPVAVDNDATVALVGELRAGAARDHDDVVMLTLGTGVGGAVAVGGQVVAGTNAMAGELGHMPVLDGGRRCPCGNDGCLEAYASGRAIGLRARELVERSSDASQLREVEHVDGKAVTLAALDGDELALRVVIEAGYWLGVGIMGLVNALDPGIVVVGGGAATLAGQLMLPEAEVVVAERILGAAHRPVPPIVQAELEDDAGAVGAALLALDTSS